MTLELIAFLFLILCSTTFNFFQYRGRLFWVYFVIVVSFLFIVRAEGYDVDLVQYARWMTQKDLGWYVYREPLYHFITRGLYSIFGDPFIVFCIIDFFSVLLLFSIVRYRFVIGKAGFSLTLVTIICVSFPFVMGYENLYRQQLAIILVFCGYFMLNTKQLTLGTLLIFCGPLLHNSVLVFIPLLYLGAWMKNKDASSVFLVYVAYGLSCLFFILIYSSTDFYWLVKSNASTGLDLGFLYVFLIIGMIFFFSSITKSNLKNVFRECPVACGGLMFLIVLSLISNSTPVERSGMSVIVLSLGEFSWRLANLRTSTQQLVGGGASILLSVPMLIMSSSFGFLLTSLNSY